MKKKKNKYYVGGSEPLTDARTASQKYAWETANPSPIVPNMDQTNLAPSNIAKVNAPSFLPDQYYTSKTEEIGKGIYDLHPAFAAIDTLGLATTGIANAINDGKNSRAEKLRYLSSLQNRYRENNPTLNDQPMYMKEGGKNKKQPEPYITHDPNDPRIKDYSDSLQAYNVGQKGHQSLSKYVGQLTNDMDMRIIDDFNKIPNVKNTNLQSIKKEYLSGLAVNNAAGKQPFPWEWSDRNKIFRNDIYKKPVQPVVYQPEKPFVRLNPQPISSKESYNYNTVNPVKGTSLDLTVDNPTSYQATWRDENSPNKQSTKYFDTLDDWKKFVNNNPDYDLQGSEEGKDYATARGYIKMGTGGQVTVDNDVRNEWNKYIQWLGTNGKKGSVDLDTNGTGFKMLDDYKKANPSTMLNKDYVTPIQQDFQKYRQWAIDQHKAGKLQIAGNFGNNYENFMPELSTVDGYPGSKTTSHSFPQNYLKTLNEDGVLEIENKGLAANITKMATGGENAPQVEAEGGENYTDQNQNILTIGDNDPTHEQGGVDLSNVDRVLENTSTNRKDIVSKALKITPDMFKEMFGFKVKKSLSHADALEVAHKYHAKEGKKVENGLKRGVDILERDKNNYYANNSLTLNMKTAQTIPSANHVFDLLFEHQEHVKDMMGVEPQKAKYGIKMAKYGDNPDDEYIDPYAGGKTKKGRTTPTGKDNAFNRNKDQYRKIWKELGIDPDALTNSEFQSKAYDYILKNSPETARKMWSDYGNTAKGIKNKIGKGYDFNNLSDDQLKNLKDAYVDGLVGVRTLEATLPPKAVAPSQPATPDGRLVTTPEEPVDDNFSLKPKGKPSRFNEPLRWYDVAGPLMSLQDSGRIPANYNPVELNEVRLKLQNPTPALEAGNRDYNAALNELPNSGAGMANSTNAFAGKYSMDNQVLSQYENANTQIKNQEVLYNANVRDRQSGVDAQSRDTFEKQYLGSREAQRQQKLSAFDDLFTRVALNRKLNREGNLLMQLSPNFDQNAQYNGNQRYFTSNVSPNSAGQTGIQYITDSQSGKKYRIMRDTDGKIISSSKLIEDKKASNTP